MDAGWLMHMLYKKETISSWTVQYVVYSTYSSFYFFPISDCFSKQFIVSDFPKTARDSRASTYK